VALKYNQHFPSKALQNICPNLDFWFEKKPSGNPGPLLLLIEETLSKYRTPFLPK
jgi:hypothetical protein